MKSAPFALTITGMLSELSMFSLLRQAGSEALRIDWPFLLIKKPSVRPPPLPPMHRFPKVTLMGASHWLIVTGRVDGVVAIQIPAGNSSFTVYWPNGRLLKQTDPSEPVSCVSGPTTFPFESM